MPIMVQCSCGKRTAVGDALAGKTIRCTGCGNGVLVVAAPQAGGKSAARKPPRASPAIYVSTGKIVGAVLFVAIVTTTIMFFVGPVKVWHQWEDIGPKASTDVKDVIGFALQAYLSQQGYYNPSKSNHMPSVDGDVLFYRPSLVMSMPEKVKFEGKSSEGDYSGFYNTQTGEIEADVAYGGMTVAGLVNLTKSTGQFHITGRDNNHQPEAECNGQKLEIVYPPKDSDK